MELYGEYITKFNGSNFAIGEPLVRCRDCTRYRPKEGAMFSCKFEYRGFTQWKLAEPDGFCKWAERKEGEQ